MTNPADTVEGGVRRFLDAEGGELGAGAWAGRAVAVAAIGTTAATAVKSPLLRQAIDERAMTLTSAVARVDPADLMADDRWGLGVVLSPWKQQIGAHCEALAPSARATGVVDTVVRMDGATVGFNTNTWAALSALEVLTAGTIPEAVLVVGTGASARSVALAVTRGWPDCELLVAGRRKDAADELAASFGGRVVPADGPAPVIVNTTTWGETEASEEQPFALDLDQIFAPGGRLFDLNNRISGLQLAALRAGCVVMSGSVMQRVTNASRATLAGYARVAV